MDLGHTFSSYSSSASSTVRGRGYYFNSKTDYVEKVTVDGFNDRSHVFKSVIIGGSGALSITLVPNLHRPDCLVAHARLQVRRLQLEVVCFLDAIPRAERGLGQVCSEIEYASVFDRLNKTLPRSVEHLIIQLGNS